MKILAIDPGIMQTAYVLWDNGTIEDKGILTNDAMLEKIKTIAPNDTFLATEMVASYGMAVGKDVFETCVWIGRIIQTFIEHSDGGEWQLIYRRQVKMFLCNSVKAKDANIRQAIIDKLGAPGTKKNPGKTYGVHADEWAALGVALYKESEIKQEQEETIA